MKINIYLVTLSEFSSKQTMFIWIWFTYYYWGVC